MLVDHYMRINFNDVDIPIGSFAILFAAVLWGTTGTVASFAPDVSPLAIGAFAMGLGGLLQAILAKNVIMQDWTYLVNSKKKILIGVLAIAIYPLAFYTSMRMAGIAIGTVVSIASAPFFTVILERFISKDNHISYRWLVSFGLGLLGIILLVYSDSSDLINQHDKKVKELGVLLGLIAGFTYAAYSFIAKNMINEGAQPKSVMGCLFGLASMVLLPSLFFTGGNLFQNGNNILVSFYMAFVPMFLGYVAFGFGLKSVNASKATLLTLFEPVVAAVLAVFIVGEKIIFLGWIGMLLIIICLVIQTKGKS